MYLTLEEYKELSFDESIEESTFKKLLSKASVVLDNVTNHFYKNHDLESDKTIRKDAFKKSLVAQIEYFIETDATTSEKLNSAPQSISMGRTTISQSSRYSPSGKNESKSIVCDDIYLYLEGTGLLYRGDVS